LPLAIDSTGIGNVCLPSPHAPISDINITPWLYHSQPANQYITFSAVDFHVALMDVGRCQWIQLCLCALDVKGGRRQMTEKQLGWSMNSTAKRWVEIWWGARKMII
jgi:hypothetical protein